MDLALTIRILREYRNYSQDYVALQLGISQKVYSNMENGITRIQALRFYDISRVLGFSMDEIIRFSLEGNPPRSDGKMEPDIQTVQLSELNERLELLERELELLKEKLA